MLYGIFYALPLPDLGSGSLIRRFSFRDQAIGIGVSMV